MRSDTGSADRSSSLRKIRAGGAAGRVAVLGMSRFQDSGPAILARAPETRTVRLRLPCVTQAHPSQPLSRLLDLSADAVLAVRAGRSLTDVLARVPAESRPGVQALTFHVMRWL